MLMKTMMSHYYTNTRVTNKKNTATQNVGEDEEQLEPSYISGWEGQWYKPLQL